MTTAAGTTRLRAGVNPITLQWFNRKGDCGLNVEYRGPGLRRQRIPGSVLSRASSDFASGATNLLAGLDYRCYEGFWRYLPDFAKLNPVKTGVATNFDCGVRTRNEGVGLEFNGVISIPYEGVYTFYTTSDDASRLSVGDAFMDVRVLSNGPGPQAAEQVPATPAERNSRPWVTLEGTVNFAGAREAGGELAMRVGNDNIRVEVFETGGFAPNFPPHGRVRVSGVYQDVITQDGSRVPGMLQVSSWKAICPVPQSGKSLATMIGDDRVINRSAGEKSAPVTIIPPITTAAEIKALPSELAKQQLPVSVCGVVTAVLPAFLAGAVVQDATKGIYISLQDIRDTKPLQRGEFCQIEGVSGPGMFAPVVVARRITHLGAGQFPQPLHATPEQLINGSLDTQYAEIEGIVTAVHGQQIALLTEGGKVTLDLSDFQSEHLAGYENALVRIRGCAFAFFNGQTHELDARSLRVMNGAVDILHEAPRDPFAAPQKTIGELLLYDPQAAPFRLLKVTGQIIYGRTGAVYLTDGTNGLHVTTRDSDLFAVGDLVDAVGFLELGGQAAELKEAVLRKTGRSPLPSPTKLTPEHLLQASYAGMLVQVDATLMNQWREGAEAVLELQSGFLAFKGRLNDGGRAIPLPPSGSRLALTGVYAPHGSPGERTVNGFELLLHSPAAIRVLSTPPWWTLSRVLVIAGVLAALLCAVLIWNKELQRKVQERGRQLEMETRHRQRAELQHAAEAERSRIARDLHDELGSGLTEVSLLASAGLGEFRNVEKSTDRFRAITEKARALVSGLDVIVWAIDPKRNSLQSFADYLGSYAEELLSASNIVCKLRIPIECDAIMLTGSVRHSLLLAIKEALNNVIRHASATEVELRMAQFDDRLEIVIADNGRGFNRNSMPSGNGVANIRQRLEALRGQCHVESEPGRGTTVKCIVPLPQSEPGYASEESHKTT